MSSQDDTGPIEIDPEEIPEYDPDDPEGDRREWLEDSEHLEKIEAVLQNDPPAGGDA
jgi:hypothetical protein